MTKYLLISIQPQHVYNILIGKKTLELRKKIPNWVWKAIARGETVIVLIYCTKAKPYVYQDYATNEDGYTYLGGYGLTDWDNEACIVNGKVVAQFEINNIDSYDFKIYNAEYFGLGNIIYSVKPFPKRVCSSSCLTYEQIKKYSGGKNIHAIHISNLKAFDKPKELGDFSCVEYGIYGAWHFLKSPISRAPQNMMAVYG